MKCQTINCENYLQCPPEVNFMLVRYEEKYELGNWCAVTEVRFDYTRFIFTNNFAVSQVSQVQRTDSVVLHGLSKIRGLWFLSFG